ncbi:MAG: TIR domain-containing protein [Acidimicrobiales bacterium]
MTIAAGGGRRGDLGLTPEELLRECRAAVSERSAARLAPLADPRSLDELDDASIYHPLLAPLSDRVRALAAVAAAVLEERPMSPPEGLGPDSAVAYEDLARWLSPSAPVAEPTAPKGQARVSVLLAGVDGGELATLLLTEVDGPPGIHQDFLRGPLTRFGPEFGEALRAAWACAAPAASSIRWAVISQRTMLPVEVLVGGSIGAGAAVGLRALANDPPAQLDELTVFTGLVEPNGAWRSLLPSDGSDQAYRRKLGALPPDSTLVVPASDVAHLEPLAASLSRSITIVGAASLDDAWAATPYDAFDVAIVHDNIAPELVLELSAGLAAQGLSVWTDLERAAPGADVGAAAAQAVSCARCSAVLISGAAPVGGLVRPDIAAAMKRAAVDPGHRVFLVLGPGCPAPFDPTVLPPALSTRLWVDLRRVSDPTTMRELLGRAVRGEGLGVVGPPSDECPYLGLLPFDEGDASRFFGRDADIQRLLEKLSAARLLTVFGLSGSGKSSLVRAGLAGVLRSRGVDDVVVVTPGASPLRVLGQAAALEPALLIVDQGEELFTLGAGDDERTAVFDLLLSVRSQVVLVMRSDFFPRLEEHPAMALQVATHQYLVAPLGSAELRIAIEEPAARAGLHLQPGLVNRLLEEAAAEPRAAMSLVQYTLVRLWEARQGATLTHAAYDALGGVRGALASRAEQLWGELTPAEQRAAKALLSRLVAVDDEIISRRPVGAEELGRVAGAGAEGLVERLVQERLLVVDDADQLNLAHEALIQHWPMLREHIESDRAEMILAQQTERDALRWEQAGRDEALLYRGSRLLQCEQWLTQEPLGSPGDVVVDFVAAGMALQAVERRTRRRRRVRAVGAALAASVVTAFATGRIWDRVFEQAAKRSARRPVAPVMVDGTVRQIELRRVSWGEYQRCVDYSRCRRAYASGEAPEAAAIVEPFAAFEYCTWIGRRMITFAEYSAMVGGPFDLTDLDWTSTPQSPASTDVWTPEANVARLTAAMTTSVAGAAPSAVPSFDMPNRVKPLTGFRCAVR